MPLLQAACKSLAEVASSVPELSTLVAAVKAAGGDLLKAVTDSKTAVTVFAPTNAVRHLPSTSPGRQSSLRLPPPAPHTRTSCEPTAEMPHVALPCHPPRALFDKVHTFAAAPEM